MCARQHACVGMPNSVIRRSSALRIAETRATEFVEAATRVWDSWDDDAVVGDREHGVWADRTKLHAPHFKGRYYDVAGVQPFPKTD